MHVHLWDKYELGLYLANGITAVRNVWGMPMHMRIKNAVNKNNNFISIVFTTGAKLTGPEYIGDDNLQLFTPEEGREKVRRYRKKGYDFIKTYNGLPHDIFDAVVDEAGICGMDIVAHPSGKVPYAYHFKPGIVSVEHAEDIVQQPLEYKLDTAKLDEVVSLIFRIAETPFCPTLIAFYNIYNMLQDSTILSNDDVQYMNPAIQKLDSKVQFERWKLLEMTMIK